MAYSRGHCATAWGSDGVHADAEAGAWRIARVTVQQHAAFRRRSAQFGAVRRGWVQFGAVRRGSAQFGAVRYLGNLLHLHC